MLKKTDSNFKCLLLFFMLFSFFKETEVSKKIQEENTHIKEEKLVSC